MNLMRGVVAYNRYRVRRFVEEDCRWFKNWSDKPVHEIQPLTIRRPDTKDDVLTYVSPWKKDEALLSLKGTGAYKGGGNVFWLDPFDINFAGDQPRYSACLDAAESYAMSEIQLQGVTEGTLSAACEARIKFLLTFTTYGRDVSWYEADHFDGSLPIVGGHAALWGFHLALFKALSFGDVAHVAVLVQAALCAPIEGVIVDSDEKLSIISMKIADSAHRVHHDFLKNSFPVFASKLMVALEPLGQRATVSTKVDFCTRNNICYSGTVVYRTMLLAAQNCYERLDGKAMRTLRYIESRCRGSKSDLTTAFSPLNRILSGRFPTRYGFI